MRWLALMLCLAMPAWAVQPDEVLDDPALEARARDLSEGLRCLVCRNESIDESNADLARDMRLLVRERLMAGDTDGQVIAYLVDRYGEYVLLRPQADGSNLILWLAPALLLLLGGGVAVVAVTRQARGGAATLDADEEARLRTLLDETSER
ncbi:cytochrome c-type biogenesis protein CcmH [Jannaschia sp. S6380]|uniref:cytochrome c-type biogenesis protein n=1 Tax=Jannaschia sp. S6380 TaxID=2926408 RepID=UPI001FF57C6D|nr:cytochrome c-type biogenesis protein [Jannaschia sp. S6380]MCK0166905.1 cytochrome c-type biogenesis protein CcmH [Jannaschia sp. S6380]